MVKINKRIKGAAIGTGTTALVIVGIMILAKRFGVGGKIIEGFGGLGSTIGEAPLAFIKELANSTGQLGEEAKKISENFQRSVGGGLLASEQKVFGGGGFVGGTANETTLTTQGGQDLPAFLRNAFDSFGKSQSGINPGASSIFDVAKAFTPSAQLQRIDKSEQVGGSAFGGFDSAQSQEQALQEAIAKSRAVFGEFFKQ